MTTLLPVWVVDDRKSGAEAGDGAGYEETAASAAALRDRILADPAGKAAYERASEEIEHHQASLAKVRKLRALAQATVAEAMGMDQSEISRLERRTDLLLSTLRRFVNATGGESPPRGQLPRRRRRASGRLDPAREQGCSAVARRLSRATFVPQQPVESGRSRARIIKPKGLLTCPNARNTWWGEGGTAPSQSENAGSIPVARSRRGASHRLAIIRHWGGG